MEGGEGSKLRGDLAPKESKLRGKLVESKPSSPKRIDTLSRLKGTLLNKLRGGLEEPPADDVSMGSEVVNRDTGTVYKVSGFREGKRAQLVNLVGEDGSRLTTSADRLREMLGTEGSAWSKKPKG